MSKPSHKSVPEAEQSPAETAPLAADAVAAAPAPPEDELTTLRREVGELRDQNLRLVAELQNQQKRIQREKQESQRYAEAELARELLVVLDDLERAQQAAGAAQDAEAVAEGMRLVGERFAKVLRDHHVVPIEAVGRPFDPTFHEAVLQQPSRELPVGIVLEQVAQGYLMHDRVLRPSRVIVSSGPPPTSQPADDTQEK
jgi:molecular chaperone GrpE